MFWGEVGGTIGHTWEWVGAKRDEGGSQFNDNTVSFCRMSPNWSSHFLLCHCLFFLSTNLPPSFLSSYFYNPLSTHLLSHSNTFTALTLSPHQLTFSPFFPPHLHHLDLKPSNFLLTLSTSVLRVGVCALPAMCTALFPSVPDIVNINRVHTIPNQTTNCITAITCTLSRVWKMWAPAGTQLNLISRVLLIEWEHLLPESDLYVFISGPDLQF